MRDITTIVCPKRLLYLWDLHYQLIDDSDYELINNFTEYKHIMSQYLENYADILDTTILSEEEVRRAKKGYKLVRELVQLNYLLTCNDPTIKRGYMDLHLSGEPLISAPTQSLLQKWLRERHRIHIAINGLYNNNIMIAYTFDICLVDANPYKEGIHSVMTYPTYEEALETALKQALNKIQ